MKTQIITEFQADVKQALTLYPVIKFPKFCKNASGHSARKIDK